MNAMKNREQLKIQFQQQYIDLSDFRPLEERIVQAVLEGKKVLLDFTAVSKGMRSDVYGELFQKIQANYLGDAAAVEAAQQVTLLFSSRTAPPYQSLLRGYEGLFNVEFAK